MDTQYHEEVLATSGRENDRLADCYDEDTRLQSAMSQLFPNFEYPDYSHLTMSAIRIRYLKMRRSAADTPTTEA